MSLAQQIKDVLVSLAVQDKLPQDLNDLDPSIFKLAFAGAVFPGEMKDRYVSLEVPLKVTGQSIDRQLQIQVKLDDEGMVIDATLEGDNEPCASTWKTYQMMKDGEE